MKAGAVPGNGCSSLPPAPFGAPLPSLLREAKKRGPLGPIIATGHNARMPMHRENKFVYAYFHLSPWGRGRANEVREGEGVTAVQNCEARTPSPDFIASLKSRPLLHG